MTRRESHRALAAMVLGTLASSPAFAEATAQAAARGGPTVHNLLVEPLAPVANPEVTLLTLDLAPGSVSKPHKHLGPVFGYILEGEILNQVDPEPAKTYHVGEFFYEPPLHVHRQMKNLSSTKPARVLVFQVGPRGKNFTVPE